MHRLAILIVLVGLTAAVAGAGPSVEGGGSAMPLGMPHGTSDVVVEDLAHILAFRISLDITAEKMYWTSPLNSKIQRSNMDGSNVEEDLARFFPFPTGVALDVVDGRMYWALQGTSPTSGDGKIQRALTAGPDPVRDSNPDSFDNLVTDLSNPRGIALDPDGGKMYWVEAGSGKVRRADLDGSSPETLVDGLGALSDIALDVAGGKMYWTDGGVGKIQRANLDGTDVELDLITGLVAPRGLALDLGLGKIYWTDQGAVSVADGKIQRANLDGSAAKDVITDLTQPTGVALDLSDGKIYWTDGGTSKIQRADIPPVSCL